MRDSDFNTIVHRDCNASSGEDLYPSRNKRIPEEERRRAMARALIEKREIERAVKREWGIEPL